MCSHSASWPLSSYLCPQAGMCSLLFYGGCLWRETSSDTSCKLNHIPLPTISDQGCGRWGQMLSFVRTNPVMNGAEGCLVGWCADRIDMTGREKDCSRRSTVCSQTRVDAWHTMLHQGCANRERRPWWRRAKHLFLPLRKSVNKYSFWDKQGE